MRNLRLIPFLAIGLACWLTTSLCIWALLPVKGGLWVAVGLAFLAAAIDLAITIQVRAPHLWRTLAFHKLGRQ